ncbi:MAG: flagellar M-ring protein FliF [Opitutae bacterium]|nr:flagellar M-ring protein FliF [Opitutae bacterium]
MNNFAKSLLALWGELGLNQRVSLIVASLAVLGGLLAVVLWSRRPDYQLLYARMSEKDAAAVISHLQTLNVAHQITSGGSAVMVPSEQVYKLRMDLASKGLPSGDGVGFEIFDKGQFGLSDFVQRTNYLRAIQGELARTITQLQGVRTARVMIVPVIDNRGHVLSEELKQDPALGTASSQMRYKQQVEDYLSKKVESMLAAVIGPGNAVVRVSAEIETEAMTSTQEKYDPEGQVVRSQTITEDVTNSAEQRATGGAVGVSANLPEKAGAADPAARPTSTSEQNRKNRTTSYEINRVTTNTTRNPGTVKNLSAAVFIAPRPAVVAAAVAGATPAAPTPAPKRTAEEMTALRQIVLNALGLKVGPGQSIDSLVSLQEVAFQSVERLPAQIEAIQTESRWMGWTEAASRWAAVGLAVLIFGYFFRLLSKQKPEPVPVEILSLAPTGSGRSLASGGGKVTPEMLNNLIRHKPANIGATLRDWVATPVASNKN